MSSLIKSGKLGQLCFKNQTVLMTAVRNHWNKDYVPGPYPKTEAERKAAAKKYNLHPDEYEPYPDDGTGYGDYPKLPAISGDARSPYYPWDNPELKRNFNEPLHVDVDLMGEDRYDVNYKPRVPGWLQFVQFFGTVGGLFCIYVLLENVKMFPAVLPKQYPGQGKVHYTFEPKS